MTNRFFFRLSFLAHATDRYSIPFHCFVFFYPSLFTIPPIPPLLNPLSSFFIFLSDCALTFGQAASRSFARPFHSPPRRQIHSLFLSSFLSFFFSLFSFFFFFYVSIVIDYDWISRNDRPPTLTFSPRAFSLPPTFDLPLVFPCSISELND